MGEEHYSIVANIETYYVFLDSCSTLFNRWPSKAIISNNNCNNKFRSHKTIVMKSLLQKDEYNCGSFCFAFLDIISNIYKENNHSYEALMNYLFKYFYNFSNDGYITEANIYLRTKNLGETFRINLYLIPKEFLCLSESIRKLKCLKQVLKEKNKKEEADMIENIISQSGSKKENIYKINKIRQEHLSILFKDY